MKFTQITIPIIITLTLPVPVNTYSAVDAYQRSYCKPKSTNTSLNTSNKQCMTSSAREKYLSLCYISSRSVKNKTLYLNDYITTHDHDLVAFSETCFNPTDDNDPYISALLPDGYDIRHVDREQGKRVGGVFLLYKNVN